VRKPCDFGESAKREYNASSFQTACTNAIAKVKAMTVITVNAEIAQQITDASMPIVLVDESGRRLGELTHGDSDIPPGLTQERWEEIQRRMREPGEYYSWQEVKKQLGW
jgi:hypothetical protein